MAEDTGELHWIPVGNLKAAVTQPAHAVDRHIKDLPRDHTRGLALGRAGAARERSTGIGRGLGNAGDETFVTREAVQDMLDDGRLTLRREPEGNFSIAQFPSPIEFLGAHGLKRPADKQ